jgi:hypothetical protein
MTGLEPVVDFLERHVQSLRAVAVAHQKDAGACSDLDDLPEPLAVILQRARARRFVVLRERFDAWAEADAVLRNAKDVHKRCVPRPRWQPFPCAVCGGGAWEDYVVYDAVWTAAGLSREKGVFACISCVADRLGRPLTKADFPPVPANNAVLYGLAHSKSIPLRGRV